VTRDQLGVQFDRPVDIFNTTLRWLKSEFTKESSYKNYKNSTMPVYARPNMTGNVYGEPNGNLLS